MYKYLLVGVACLSLIGVSSVQAKHRHRHHHRPVVIYYEDPYADYDYRYGYPNYYTNDFISPGVRFDIDIGHHRPHNR